MSEPKVPPVCPENCAWLPVERCRSTRDNYEVTPLALCISGRWVHKLYAGYSAPEGAARLMHKLYPGEKPPLDDRPSEDAWFLHSDGTWSGIYESRPRYLEGDVGWYMPVEFAPIPTALPDFGEKGHRFLRQGERPFAPEHVFEVYGSALELIHKDHWVQQRVVVPFNMPALPEEEDNPLEDARIDAILSGRLSPAVLPSEMSNKDLSKILRCIADRGQVFDGRSTWLWEAAERLARGE